MGNAHIDAHGARDERDQMRQPTQEGKSKERSQEKLAASVRVRIQLRIQFRCKLRLATLSINARTPSFLSFSGTRRHVLLALKLVESTLPSKRQVQTTLAGGMNAINDPDSINEI